MLSLRQNKKIVFSRTCAGKRHLKSRERGDRKGANGGKREGERSERESVVTRQDKISRRVGGHAPPQRHLERSAATMKTRFTGRKQNKRKRILLSSRKYHKNPPFPGHAPGKDPLKAANAATKEGFTGRKRVKRKRLPVVPRQNKDSRRVGGHAPPQRHLKRSAATMKTRFTGRKQPNELLAK